MRLTSCYSIEHLASALVKKYGKDSQIKIVERKNRELEDVIEITVVKVLSDTDYVIYNASERLFWSNVDGWVSLKSATVFPVKDKEKYQHLPKGGSWVLNKTAADFPVARD